LGSVFWVCLHFVFLRKKVGFPWLFRGPLWFSLTVAPEHLWVYPLGSTDANASLWDLLPSWSLVLFHGAALADPWV
jgi:hypothetical protein